MNESQGDLTSFSQQTPELKKIAQEKNVREEGNGKEEKKEKEEKRGGERSDDMEGCFTWVINFL